MRASPIAVLVGLAAAVLAGAFAPRAAAHDAPTWEVRAARGDGRLVVVLSGDDALWGAARADAAAASLVARDAEGRPVALRAAIEPREGGGAAVRFEGADPAGPLTLALSLFGRADAGEAVVAWEEPDGPRLARVELPGSVLLSPAAARVTIGAFLASGVEHILTGWDHLAFLLVLLLATRRLKDVALVVTAFTLAHSVTLALAVADVVRLPSGPVEATIAASIVVAAGANLVSREPRPRAAVALAFGFGLVHGLGFSSLLSERLASATSGKAVAVAAFNVGVEAGQLALVVVLAPLLLAWRRRSPVTYGRIALHGASAAVAVLGLVWLAGRTIA